MVGIYYRLLCADPVSLVLLVCSFFVGMHLLYGTPGQTALSSLAETHAVPIYISRPCLHLMAPQASDSSRTTNYLTTTTLAYHLHEARANHGPTSIAGKDL